LDALRRQEVTVEALKCFREDGGVFPIGAKARFEVSGSDRVRYLNGQLTRNVEKLKSGVAAPACLLTAKGKLCAHVFLWVEATSIILETEASLLEDVEARLGRYIIADDVMVQACPVEEAGFHVFGHEAPLGTLSIERLGVRGYDVGTPPPDIPIAPLEAIEVLRIERCIPRWGSELDGSSLVQEARLEDTSVDFDKGCYVGQEVVSRLRSVGRVNRLLTAFTATLVSTADVRPTLRVDSPDGPVAGTLTSIAPRFGLAQTAALGYVSRQFEKVAQFLVTDSAGHLLGTAEKRATSIP